MTSKIKQSHGLCGVKTQVTFSKANLCKMHHIEKIFKTHLEAPLKLQVEDLQLMDMCIIFYNLKISKIKHCFGNLIPQLESLKLPLANDHRNSPNVCQISKRNRKKKEIILKHLLMFQELKVKSSTGE